MKLEVTKKDGLEDFVCDRLIDLSFRNKELNNKVKIIETVQYFTFTMKLLFAKIRLNIDIYRCTDYTLWIRVSINNCDIFIREVFDSRPGDHIYKGNIKL
jgi:hypothetical protein